MESISCTLGFEQNPQLSQDEGYLRYSLLLLKVSPLKCGKLISEWGMDIFRIFHDK